MARTLRRMKIRRVSLVETPANEHSRVVLFKSDASESYERRNQAVYEGLRRMMGDPYAPGATRWSVLATFADRVVVDVGGTLFSYPYEVGDDGAATFGEREPSGVEYKAEWTAAYVNDLPDSSFAVVESGGEKDDDGRTVPRSLRHLPYRDRDGKVDLPHLRNALSRLPQSKLSPELRERARRKLVAAARDAGVGEAGEEGKSMSPEEMEDEMKDLRAKLKALQEENDGLKAKLKASEEKSSSAEADRDALKAKVAHLEMSPEEREKAEWAQMPPSVRKRMETDSAELKALREEKATAASKAMATEIVRKGVAAKPDDLAKALRSAAAIPKEDYDVLVGALTKAAEAVAQGALLKEFGQDDRGGGEGTALAEVRRLVKERVEKSAGKLAETDAYGQVFAENPGLYTRYVRENETHGRKE